MNANENQGIEICLGKLRLLKKLISSPIAQCNLVAFQAITEHIVHTGQKECVVENDLGNAIKAYCPTFNKEYLASIPIGMLTIDGLNHIQGSN